MALEMSGGLRRLLLGPRVSSNRSGSGDLTKHLSHFAAGVRKPRLGLTEKHSEGFGLTLVYSGLILLSPSGVME